MMMKVAFAANCLCSIPLSHFMTSNFASETASGPYNLQLCCGPHIPYGNGTVITTQANPTRDGYSVCAVDNVIVHRGKEVVSYMIDWDETSNLGKFVVNTIFNQVTLVILVLLLTLGMIVMKVYNKILQNNIKKLNLKNDVDQTAMFYRLEEVGMAHLLE